MAYTYKKLTDVDLIETATNPNLLIEEDGDIKKISASNVAAPQVQADWNETDDTSPAFILNKPELSSGVITYSEGCGCFFRNGEIGTFDQVAEDWYGGSVLRFGGGSNSCPIVGVSFRYDPYPNKVGVSFDYISNKTIQTYGYPG